MFNKPKKLKKIPSDLVSYIQIETEAIKDANDKMMISSYCLSKLEMVNWYLELLEVGSKKYIVPQSKAHLEMVRDQLMACHMFSNSIFAYCLDKTSDQGVRLDWYMAEEGNADGWKVEDCYILEQMRDATTIPNVTRMEQDDGTVCYFFGDTCIRVHESHEDGKIHLEPVSGDQTACGEWVDLTIDRVYGYCTLLERHLNRKEGH